MQSYADKHKNVSGLKDLAAQVQLAADKVDSKRSSKLR